MMPDGDDLPQRFATRMGHMLGPDFPSRLGLAVSGGGDSMAMLALAVPWARHMGIPLRVATVDHGLRADSADEAAMVAAECALLGVEHATLRWQGWDGSGNTQMAAREARRALIQAWRGNIDHVLFAHTQDDQAETVLMRLARGSGVEGLSGMSEQSVTPEGWQILRPLLGTTRAQLRHYIKVLKVPFVDDPSNADPRFDRVKARTALAHLHDLGITTARLADTATAMQTARQALSIRMQAVSDACVSTLFGHLQIDRDIFATIEPDTQRRLMAHALQWAAHAPYRPRLNSLSRVLDEVHAGTSATLHGCQIIVGKAKLHVVRELCKVSEVTAPADQVWDNVWRLENPAAAQGCHIAALGPDGLAQVTRPEATPAAALYSLPALWKDGQVLAAPDLKITNAAPEFAFFRCPNWPLWIHSGI